MIDYFTNGSSVYFVGAKDLFAKIVSLQPACPAFLREHGRGWILVEFVATSLTLSRCTSTADFAGMWYGFEQSRNPEEAIRCYDLDSLKNCAYFRHDANPVATTTAWLSRTTSSGYPQLWSPAVVQVGSDPIVCGTI